MERIPIHSSKRGTEEARAGAFTLIELLIVVAIIAILAAIAVPNFLLAQVRAKVSRVKADLRSMATATEAYQTDWQKYPVPADHNGVQQPMASATDLFYETRSSTLLTTPVSFISSRLPDPFAPDSTFEHKEYHYSTRPYAVVTSGNDLQYGTFADAHLGGQAPSAQFFYLSLGTDLDLDSPDLSANPDGPALYDATNGTVSSGDIGFWGPGVGFRN